MSSDCENSASASFCNVLVSGSDWVWCSLHGRKNDKTKKRGNRKKWDVYRLATFCFHIHHFRRGTIFCVQNTRKNGLKMNVETNDKGTPQSTTFCCFRQSGLREWNISEFFFNCLVRKPQGFGIPCWLALFFRLHRNLNLLIPQIPNPKSS